MSITTRRLTQPHCVHGSAPRPTPPKARWSMSHRSDTRLSLNKRLLFPNCISPMVRSRLRAHLLSSSLPIPLFFFTVGSLQSGFRHLFEGIRRKPPNRAGPLAVERTERSGGYRESAPAYRTPYRAGPSRGSGYVREPTGILPGRDPPCPVPLSLDHLHRFRSSSGSSVGNTFSTIKR
jgi:hypothetical protein